MKSSKKDSKVNLKLLSKVLKLLSIFENDSSDSEKSKEESIEEKEKDKRKHNKSNIKKNEDKRIEVDNEDENKYYIYFIDKWMYKYHRTDINNKKISLRCSDRKCRGTAVVDNEIKKHSNPHSIAFEDHEYM